MVRNGRTTRTDDKQRPISEFLTGWMRPRPTHSSDTASDSSKLTSLAEATPQPGPLLSRQDTNGSERTPGDDENALPTQSNDILGMNVVGNDETVKSETGSFSPGSTAEIIDHETLPTEPPLNHATDLDGTNDLDAEYAQSDDDEDLPPLPLSTSSRAMPLARSQQGSGANVSFRTTSTLTTLPPSSQLSRSSSRRVIDRNGAVVVTNSSPDHTPVEISSSSDSELEDLDLVLGKKTKQEQSPPTSNDKPQRRQLRSRLLHRPQSPCVPSFPEPPRKKLKFDFHSIMNSAKQQADLDARIKALEESAMELDQGAEESPDDAAIDKGLDNAVDGDENAKFKLKLAMRRSDAFDKEVRFHLFDAPSQHLERDLPFPKDEAERWPWSAAFEGKVIEIRS